MKHIVGTLVLLLGIAGLVLGGMRMHAGIHEDERFDAPAAVLATLGAVLVSFAASALFLPLEAVRVQDQPVVRSLGSLSPPTFAPIKKLAQKQD
ncbi:MAG: hypothetical protein MHM6MM_007457 [Cercozoa sp. M6MM]